jgi:hypothetical protein
MRWPISLRKAFSTSRKLSPRPVNVLVLGKSMAPNAFDTAVQEPVCGDLYSLKLVGSKTFPTVPETALNSLLRSIRMTVLNFIPTTAGSSGCGTSFRIPGLTFGSGRGSTRIACSAIFVGLGSDVGTGGGGTGIADSSIIFLHKVHSMRVFDCHVCPPDHWDVPQLGKTLGTLCITLAGLRYADRDGP